MAFYSINLTYLAISYINDKKCTLPNKHKQNTVINNRKIVLRYSKDIHLKDTTKMSYLCNDICFFFCCFSFCL